MIEPEFPSEGKNPKFATPNDKGVWGPHDYGNVFYRDAAPSYERLVIGPSRDHVDMMLALAQAWSQECFYVLYVLLTPHAVAKPGRYQSPLFNSHDDLSGFFLRHKSFLESDGRHHVWVSSPKGKERLIYDQHNVIFGYGNLLDYEMFLSSKDFSVEEFWFPSPHGHGYPSENDKHESALMNHFPWIYSPLHEDDEWD